MSLHSSLEAVVWHACGRVDVCVWLGMICSQRTAVIPFYLLSLQTTKDASWLGGERERERGGGECVCVCARAHT